MTYLGIVDHLRFADLCRVNGDLDLFDGSEQTRSLPVLHHALHLPTRAQAHTVVTWHESKHTRALC